MSSDTTSILAVIPARGGSKRLENKNIRPVDGIPLVVRTARIAQEAGIEHVVVSTESDAVRKALKTESYVHVLARPTELATDDASVEDVLAHVVSWIPEGDVLCLMQPTSPCLKVDSLKRALEIVVGGQADILISVSPTYAPCGAFYIIKRSRFIEMPSFWTEKTHCFKLSAREAIDINYIWEWAIANAAAQNWVYW
jgi:CMP-N-acetylneuraminic acid synthetase